MGRFKTLEERQNKQMTKKGKLNTLKELPKNIPQVAAPTTFTKTEETK